MNRREFLAGTAAAAVMPQTPRAYTDLTTIAARVTIPAGSWVVLDVTGDGEPLFFDGKTFEPLSVEWV